MMIFSMIIGVFTRFLKQIIFGVLVFIYAYNYYVLVSVSSNIFYSTIPHKEIFFIGILLYFMHLILMFLLQKIYLKKSIIASLVWTTFFIVLFFIVVLYLLHLIFVSDFLLFNFNIDKYLPMMNYDGNFNELESKKVFSEDEIFDFKKIFFVYVYTLILLLISNSIIIMKLAKR